MQRFRLILRKTKQYAVVALCIVYIIILHIVIITFFFNPNVINRIKYKIGFERPEITEFYKTLLTFHLRSDVLLPDNSVIFIGDSITQGLCVNCVSKDAVNYGIGNDTTVGVLNRISKYESINSARIIVLAIGINDIYRRNDKGILRNLNKIVKFIPKTTNILISSILPVDEVMCSMPEINNNRIKSLNNKMKQILNKYDNCFFLNNSEGLVDVNGNLKRNYHIGDGVHLSTDGYKIWINALKRGITEIEQQYKG